MANPLNSEIESGVKELITKITGYECDNSNFKSLEKNILSKIRKSDTMYFTGQKDMKNAVWSMADKFNFHSFFKQGELLKQLYDKYINPELSENERIKRLNNVKFLLEMSKNPIEFFVQNPDYDFLDESQEQIVEDWGAFLNEGIERWSPVNDISFFDSDSEVEQSEAIVITKSTIKIEPVSKLEVVNYSKSRENLLKMIQHGWFGNHKVTTKPFSRSVEANVEAVWEDFLRKESCGLIEIEPATTLTEYKVMRELFWQIFGAHNSTIFQFVENELICRSDITIASMRPIAFKKLMSPFLKYIEVLEEFKCFFEAIKASNISKTYQVYGSGVQKMLKPFLHDLLELEILIRNQDTTMTLLNFLILIDEKFAPILLLKKIHDNVICDDFTKKSPLECALSLINNLRKNIRSGLNKIERDICLTLYLESLYHYLLLCDSWLVKHNFTDVTDEFIIINKNQNHWYQCDTFEMNFFLRENYQNTDPIVTIISESVLQIGRNIHFLDLLGDQELIVDHSETIYNEFIRRFLEEISMENVSKSINSDIEPKITNRHEMGDCITFDVFLVKAFENYNKKDIGHDIKTDTTLYKRITEITNDLFPLENVCHRIFKNILKDRFTISGLMVKNLLIEKFYLDKQLDFLRKIYLFWDDFIFPIYTRLFQEMNVGARNWGNSYSITTHLQDITMDLYPNFYENCAVQVSEVWKSCRDSLEACNLIHLNYTLNWPLTIIITDVHMNMYKEIFQFILKLKWALYAINHMIFADIEPKNTEIEITKLAKDRLKYLRFHLINILNQLQHYVYGFVFTKAGIKFELDMEKANDLTSMIAAHNDFITTIYEIIVQIRDTKNQDFGFMTLLKTVKMLKIIWNDVKQAGRTNLNNCFQLYKKSSDVINTLINPIVTC